MKMCKKKAQPFPASDNDVISLGYLDAWFVGAGRTVTDTRPHVEGTHGATVGLLNLIHNTRVSFVLLLQELLNLQTEPHPDLRIIIFIAPTFNVSQY